MTSRWTLARIGVLLSIILLLAVAAACSSDGDDDGAGAAQPVATSAAAGPAPTAAPPELGPLPTERVIVGIVPFSQEANTRRIIGQIAAVQFDPMDESLIGMDATNGQQIPELATEWNLENGNAWRFKLREGIPFHKGWGEVTAEDVKFAYEEYIKEDAVGGVRSPLVKGIDNVEVVNDHEVVFHLKIFDADLTNLLSRAQPAVSIVSKKHFESLGGDPDFGDEPLAGSGPYQFLKREQNAWMRFERVTDHWRVTPEFPELEFRYMAESSSRLAALLTGEIHITNIPEDLIPTATDRGMKVINGTAPLSRVGFRTYCCYIDPDTKVYPMHPDSPLQDIRVRQALNKAINRDELNQAFLAGKGELMYLQNFKRNVAAGWTEDWVQRFPEAYGYDPTAARNLLAEAGYNNNNPLETNIGVFKISQLAGADDLAESIGGYFQDIGVKVKLVSEDGATRRAKSRSQKYINDFHIQVTSSAQIVGSSLNTNTSFTRSATTPEMDAKFLEVRAETDDGRREQLWTEFGNLLYDSFTYVPLFWLPAQVVVNPEVVSDYVWTGSLSGFWSHLWNVKAAR